MMMEALKWISMYFFKHIFKEIVILNTLSHDD